ncbi:MAG: helix-turn-helix transcriptional regulator [Cyclobacteriaceae bacterium]|nr:helix-turn-helix transcriptional regulator [Cyclobacteriaceae bacterium HetDA_MAG_MS6]
MYLTQFPDIQWLRKNAKENFQGGRDYQGRALSSAGWPTVILNTKSSGIERDNIVGPFSLFFNLRGLSRVRLDRKWFQVSEGFYCISNKGQSYDLHIPKVDQVETLNIHFGQSLFYEVAQLITKGHSFTLDQSCNSCNTVFELLPKTILLSSGLRDKLRKLYRYGLTAGEEYSIDTEYELTSTLLEYVLLDAMERSGKLDNLNSSKTSTRKELFRRISVGIEYIHDNRLVGLDLDSIAASCSLSKFHMIRTFKEIYGQTPIEYITRLRLQRALELLQNTKKDFGDIAFQLGFSERSAFTRFVKKRTGKTPSGVRNSN